MPLDRTDPDYRPMEIMLGPRAGYSDLRDYADQVSRGPRDELEDRIRTLPLSDSERVRLLFAFALWNGSVAVNVWELTRFDLANRARVMEAFAAFLGVV